MEVIEISRQYIKTPDRSQTYVEKIYGVLGRRTEASPDGLCPIDVTLKFLRFCHSQSCGKCVPCRVGLARLAALIQDVVDGVAEPQSLELIRQTAVSIYDSADCVIGVEAARMVIGSISDFADDYAEHLQHHRCLESLDSSAPCIAKCPAAVEIPGYVALVHEGRLEEAVALIRKDNPFPVACAYVCEHPCELHCRRNMLDASVNIRALKRYAVDNCGPVPPARRAEATGKSVGIIGGGPSGLTAAYYLALMGHSVTVYEQREALGGMLRYGIPNYRLPKELLDRDIEAILQAGVTARCGVRVGREISYAELRAAHDCVYVAIGDHTDKKMGIPGEESEGVVPAVTFLREVGENRAPNLSGKRVVVIGAGNVAMDATRTAIRLGASPVRCVYRRRREDMPALKTEIESAVEEGAALYTLQSPHHIESDESGHVAALWTQPQMVGLVGSDGRPRTMDADAPLMRIPADIIIAAIGQAIDAEDMSGLNQYITRGAFKADAAGRLPEQGLYAGGDCVTGPATVIRAVEAGKVAAANIDQFLGFHHTIETDIEIPRPRIINRTPTGRVNTSEREAEERKHDFACAENGMTCREAMQESSRCLRCDHYGYGIFRGGKAVKW